MPRKLAALALFLALTAFASSAEAVSQKIRNSCSSGADLDAVIKACTQLIAAKESRESQAIAFHNRGSAQYRKGDYARAIADLTSAIELDPKLAEAFNTRAWAYYYKWEPDYGSAIADATRAIELDPKLAERDPKLADGFARRAAGAYNRTEYDRAIVEATRANQLDPKNVLAFLSRGRAYNEKGDYERAIADLTRGIELSPTFANSHLYRGVAHLKIGKLDLARADLTKALELKPDYPEAKAKLAELEQAEAVAKGGVAASSPAAAQPTTEPAPTAQTAVASPQAPASPLVAAPPGKRVALVIGNAQYQNIGRLDNPANDARLIAQALKEDGFELVGDSAQLDLDKASLERAVQEFGNRLQGADVALFYYAGHGVQVRGANYLVPVNANPTKETDVDFQMLDANLVLRQMESAGTRLNLVMLDACRNNPFAGRGLRATGGGLAQMQAPEGTLISFATEPGTVAQDGSDGNSPYTKALAEIIRTPGLGIFDTFNQVGLKVKQRTGGAQRPWLSSSPIEGVFYFKHGN